MIRRVWPVGAVLGWHGLYGWLRPAISRGTETQLEILGRIVRGEYQCWALSGPADGVVLTSVGPTRDTGARCLWPKYASGRVNGPRAETIRAIMRIFEDMAKADGCSECRIEAVRPGWRRYFPDYADNGRNGSTIMLRKVL